MCRRYAESFRERDAVAKGAFPQLRERLVKPLARRLCVRLRLSLSNPS